MRLGVELLLHVYASTGLSSLHMIDGPRDVFDLELEQHKFVEESREEDKNPVSSRGSVHLIFSKSTAL